jgi:hypothetical protein
LSLRKWSSIFHHMTSRSRSQRIHVLSACSPHCWSAKTYQQDFCRILPFCLNCSGPFLC